MTLEKKLQELLADWTAGVESWSDAKNEAIIGERTGVTECIRDLESVLRHHRWETTDSVSEGPRPPRCSVCGASRIVKEDGTVAACSLVPGKDGTGGCPDPLRDYNAEQHSSRTQAAEPRPSEAKGRWVCNACGNTEDKEREVSCWKCGKGEMIYTRPTSAGFDPEHCPTCREWANRHAPLGPKIEVKSELWDAAKLKMKQLEAQIQRSGASQLEKSNMLHTHSKLCMFAGDAWESFVVRPAQRTNEAKDLEKAFAEDASNVESILLNEVVRAARKAMAHHCSANDRKHDRTWVALDEVLSQAEARPRTNESKTGPCAVPGCPNEWYVGARVCKGHFEDAAQRCNPRTDNPQSAPVEGRTYGDGWDDAIEHVYKVLGDRFTRRAKVGEP